MSINSTSAISDFRLSQDDVTVLHNHPLTIPLVQCLCFHLRFRSSLSLRSLPAPFESRFFQIHWSRLVTFGSQASHCFLSVQLRNFCFLATPPSLLSTTSRDTTALACIYRACSCPQLLPVKRFPTAKAHRDYPISKITLLHVHKVSFCSFTNT